MYSALFCILIGVLLVCPETESQVTITPHFSSSVRVSEGQSVTLKWTYTIQGASFRRADFRISGEATAIIEASLTGKPFTSDDRVSANIMGTNVTITFRTVDRNDSNDYTLVILTSDGSITGIADVKIIVQVPTSNIVTSSNQTVSLFNELTLNCSADGRPTPTITWTRLSDNTVVNMTLNISSRQYGGCYRCTADNGVGKALTKDVCINVLFPPMVTLENKFFVGRGQTASLNCEVEGNPTPSIHWIPCDPPNTGCNKQYLNISDVQTPRANYTCTASNNEGSDSETTLLIIGGNKIFLRISTSGECDKKDSVWETLQSELVKVFANTQSYTGAELIADTRCGSLIFDVVLRFNTQVSKDVIVSEIQKAIVDDRLGGLRVKVFPDIGIPPVSLRLPTLNTPKPKSDNTWIIVGGVLGAVSLSVIIAVTVWCVRKKKYSNETKGTGGQKRAYQESAYDNAPGNTHLVEMVYVGYQQPTPRNDLQEGQYAPLNPSTRSWEVPRHHVTIEKIIGKGAFGQVAKATADGLRGMPQKTLVAVKMTKAGAPASDRKDLLSELEVMKTLKPHPHVIKLIGCVTQSEPLLVLIEYVPYGDLLDYLRKSRGLHDTYYKDPDIKPQTSLTSQQLMKFAWQIADGMKYLSSRSIIHRDLAARNVLVGERETCKVTDFGMARDVRQENIYERKTKGRLPVKWTAYEALMFGTYTTKSDVWSFGVLLYEIFTIGGSPYPRMDGRKIANLLQEGYRMPKPQHVDNALYKIMTSCWLEDSNARPTFLDLKNKLKNMENQHKRLINMDIYDNTQLYANVEDLA
ncbi:fibroblast growth factor receptor 3-like [Montipora foliosa]|uniref:fibroblast growth factor receptor 3-like n=1 Tax=Montipora foliosa TaxID=591990 RepID=UPI0035F14AD1